VNSESARKTQTEWRDFLRHTDSKGDYRAWREYKSKWIQSLPANNRKTIDEIISTINKDENMLLNILDRQFYILVHWKTTEKEINYRRFFTINQLICLRMEEKYVFNEYHQFLHLLFKEGLIHGLRIDHIDGLKDPATYIQNLRALFGDSCYIIAEKILEAKEAIPQSWPLQGTSGYEFLAFVNRLLTDKKGARKLLEFYRTLVPALPTYRKLVFENKKLILDHYMGGEWDNLVHYFFDLKLHQENVEKTKIKEALGLFMISLPVYRIYPDKFPLEEGEKKIIQETFAKASQLDHPIKNELDYLHNLFVSPLLENQSNTLAFLQRLMQFTGPLTAKGVEDTTFYVYNPLISHDEVGDSPSKLGITIDEFHSRMLERQQTTPLSLNATATHDTKRGEDVRVRLNVLSEVPDEWQTAVSQWLEMNKQFRQEINGKTAPSINDEYFIYQSLVGGFPEDLVVNDTWVKRLQEYIIKVVREAKVNSNWESPDERYENACTEFIAGIIKEERRFLQSVLSVVQKIYSHANIHALTQVLVKITAPGIPDIYQGCELWDLSYVDPDNRRPVDYNIRKNYLNEIMQKEKEGLEQLLSFLASHRNAGVEKLFVTWKALNFRKRHELIFREGTYRQLHVKGTETFAASYARQLKDQWVLVVLPLALDHPEEADVSSKEKWKGGYIELPDHAPTHWKNIFTGKIIQRGGGLSLDQVFLDFPVAFLLSARVGES
jgi:(1->4)-alpha-D-glucan 1-alpha-D-glucosylmutase